MFYSRKYLKSTIDKYFSISKKKYLLELWVQFIEEVEEFYWEKYANVKNSKSTQDFKKDSLSSKFTDSFAIVFQEQVKKKIDDLIKNDLPLPYTGKENKTSITGSSLLNNFLKVNGFSNEVKDSTINLFCLYLGYDDFEDFKIKNREKLYPKVIKFYLDYPKLNSFIIVSIVCMALISVYLKTGTPSDETIKDFIVVANRAEYDSYKKLPIVDSINVDRYWTKKGISRKRIMEILLKHPKLGRILVDTLQSSGAKIVNFKVIFKSRYYIRIETEEHWRLQWYNTKTKVFDKIYDRVDAQVYELLREDNLWKINDNWHLKKPDEIIIN